MGFNYFHLFITPVTHHHNTGGSSGDAKISLPLSTHTRRLERIDTRPRFWITVHLTNAHHSGLSTHEYGRLRHYRQPQLANTKYLHKPSSQGRIDVVNIVVPTANRTEPRISY